MKAKRCLFAVLALFLSLPLNSATFVIPTDEELIDVSKGIVRGIVIDSYARRDSDGRIETVYRLAVDEVLKGFISDRVIEIVQIGGRIGNQFLVVPGSPDYRAGTKYVVFLTENREGFWTTRDFTLGAFELLNDGSRARYTRNMKDAAGWSLDGGPIVEPLRNADDFLQQIRARVRETGGRVTATAIKAAALDMDLRAAATVGASAWTNDGASDVNYSVSPTPASANTQAEQDGEDRVIPDDPQGLIAGTFTGSGTVGICFFGGFIQNTTDTDGETYTANITGADVVINDGVMSSNIGGTGNFNSVLTHEIGHSLAFRHADGDRGQSLQNTCAGPLPCSSSAIMTAFVTAGLNGAIQAWDIDAVRKVYGNSPGGISYTYAVSAPATGAWRRGNGTTSWRIVETACTPTTISAHPQGTSIASGATHAMSVTAAGTGPFTYQWFQGTSGTTTTPVGTNSSSFTTPALSSTTSYWVRVSSACTPAGVNSNTATVTIVACTPTTISAHPQGVSIQSSQTTTLSVTAAGTGPFTYQWFQGTSGTTTTPVGTNSPSFTTPALSSTTSFWVRVSSACTPGGVNSNTATVTVVPCTAPVITQEPSDASVVAGGFAFLSVLNTGTAPFTYQWFRGIRGDTSSGVIGSSQNFQTPALTQTTNFWVRILNCGGQVDSRTATVSVTACNAPQITTQPQNASVSPGGSATLSVLATGTSLIYQWFRGQSGDQSSQVSGATSATLTTGALQQTTSFWVKVTSNCGSLQSVNSQTATVTVSTCAITITTQPQGTSGVGGTSATLRVVATGSPANATLSYQWFRGVAGQPSTPIAGATTSTFNTGPLVATTSFFVRVTSSCGATVNSATATITVNPRRTKRPGRRR